MEMEREREKEVGEMRSGLGVRGRAAATQDRSTLPTAPSCTQRLAIARLERPLGRSQGPVVTPASHMTD